MIETPPTPPQANQAAPDRRFRMVRAGFPELIGTLVAYAAPATQHLDEAIRSHHELTGADPNESVRDTPHFDTVEDWCKQHPSDAARIVLTAVYLASGRFAVQDLAEPPAPAPNPTLDAAAAVAAAQATAAPAAAEPPTNEGAD